MLLFKIIKVFMVVSLMCVFSACHPHVESNATGASDDAAPRVDHGQSANTAAVGSIDHQSWRLQSIAENDKTLPLPQDISITFVIDDKGMLAGRGPVNEFSGHALLNTPGKLIWKSPLISTRKGGPTHLMDLENKLLRVLRSDFSYSLSKGILRIEVDGFVTEWEVESE